MLNTKNMNSIEQIAATIAHEVKNPLSLVKANIDLLESTDVDRVYSKNYNVIKSELNKINEMMLDFLHLTSENNFEFDIIYLYDIVSSIYDSYCITLSGRIKFSMCCDSKDISVLGSEQSIKRVVLNIFKNAVEAIGNRNGIINVNIYSDGRNAFISVEDNGTGISSDDFKKLGNTFFTTKQNGNGLGVPICKKIISEHNGKIDFNNNSLGGCTVTLTLPLYQFY